MTDLLAARLEMSAALAFHIPFAVAGVALPSMILAAEIRARRKGAAGERLLAESWGRLLGVLFAVGAASGTVVGFLLGLLWPGFLVLAGSVVGFAFVVEGFFFFLEAIALGAILYGRNRIPEIVRLGSLAVIGLASFASALLIVSVNAWMNTPSGIEIGPGGRIGEVDLLRVLLPPAFPTEAVHVLSTAFLALSFALLGFHAAGVRKRPESSVHRAGLRIALAFAISFAPLAILTGDASAKHDARRQPSKLAAAEALFETKAGAPLSIGGWPDMENRRMVGAIEIPRMLSFLATGSFSGKVIGLDAFPPEEWPPVPWVHASFQVMVGCGFAMLGIALWGAALWFCPRPLEGRRLFLLAAAIAAPAGFVAIEAGWIVTEVGRQPWVIRGILRTSEAATAVPNLVVPLAVLAIIEGLLAAAVILFLRREWMAASAPPPGAP
ncbi:MAG: cytochrome ubiquinol oxidase subunit I [Planctomycetota bacterium]